MPNASVDQCYQDLGPRLCWPLDVKTAWDAWPLEQIPSTGVRNLRPPETPAVRDDWPYLEASVSPTPYSPAQHIQHGRRLHKFATPQGCLLDVQDESSTQTHLAPALHVTGSTHRAARDMRSYSFASPRAKIDATVENIRRQHSRNRNYGSYAASRYLFSLGLTVHRSRRVCLAYGVLLIFKSFSSRALCKRSLVR